jgi:hypothetical protein
MRRRWAAVVRDITDKAQNVRALQTINWAMPPRAQIPPRIPFRFPRRTQTPPFDVAEIILADVAEGLSVT